MYQVLYSPLAFTHAVRVWSTLSPLGFLICHSSFHPQFRCSSPRPPQLRCFSEFPLLLYLDLTLPNPRITVTPTVSFSRLIRILPVTFTVASRGKANMWPVVSKQVFVESMNESMNDTPQSEIKFQGVVPDPITSKSQRNGHLLTMRFPVWGVRQKETCNTLPCLQSCSRPAPAQVWRPSPPLLLPLSQGGQMVLTFRP